MFDGRPGLLLRALEGAAGLYDSFSIGICNVVMTVMSMSPRKAVRKAPMTIHIKSRMEMMTRSWPLESELEAVCFLLDEGQERDVQDKEEGVDDG